MLTVRAGKRGRARVVPLHPSVLPPLTVCAGKRGRPRLIPLHPSVLPPLRDYAAGRERRFGPPAASEAFFRTDRSDRISYNAANSTFIVLRCQLGWTAAGRACTPRVLRWQMGGKAADGNPSADGEFGSASVSARCHPV